MKKIIYLLAVCMSMILVTGCNSNNTTDNIADDSSVQMVNDNTENAADSAEKDTAEELPEQEDPQETIEPVTAQLNMEEPFNNTRIKVACTGFAQYDELNGDSYCDVPKEGNVFVVMYFNIENYTRTGTYFSAESFRSSVDQTDITHTFLVNDPEGYPTIFKNIPAESGINGYIVWEVPENWKELSFTYTGWKESHAVILNGTFTPADLKTPTPYDQL